MTLSPRQKILLGILGAVVLVAIVVGPGRDGRPASTRRSEQARARDARLRAEAARAPLVTEVVELRDELLAPGGERYEIGRDPFRYAPMERPAPPPPKPVERPEPEPAPEPEPKPAPPPPGPQPPSADHLNYLGRFGYPQDPIAVLTSGEEIFNVKEGDVVEARFVVEEIGYESIALGYVDFPDVPATRIPVGG